MMRLVLVGLAGCAQGGDLTPDAKRYDDAPVDIILGDAPSLQTLSQTASTMLEAGTSRACNASSGTAANNYYRVFDLAAFNITTDFHVTQVSFQVEHCDEFAGTAGVDVVVRVGTYSGTVGETLMLAGMTIRESKDAHVPEVIETGDPPVTPGGTVTTNFDTVIAAGQKLFVEVDSPDGTNLHQFFMGANNDGETGFGYVLAPTCGVMVPTSISTVANLPIHLLLTVSGWY